MTVGLTGGIASGKSVVAQAFAELGVEIIDTDILAREVVLPDQPALAAITRAFGTRVLNVAGELDRKVMREIIFPDPELRHHLEQILHPAIRQKMWQRVAEANGDYVVLVIPLLVETGLHREVDRVLVVDVDPDRQRQWLQARDGSDDREIDGVLAAQCDRELRLAEADDVISNNDTLEALSEQVSGLHRQYQELCNRQL
jgi:dephospho-CoA kinase